MVIDRADKGLHRNVRITTIEGPLALPLLNVITQEPEERANLPLAIFLGELVEIADFEQQYFSTFPPIVVGDHVLVGTGNDLDAPGFLQSLDPETGKLQWKFYTVPMNAGDPGLETWPSLDAARHGGGQVWVPGAYDPESKLYIFGTGNPTPGYTGVGRKGGRSLKDAQ